MNFIKKIFDGKPDKFVHMQFQKFSRGEFLNRALINAKFRAKKFSISTGPEFANGIVKDLAKKIEGTKTKITGAIISTQDLTGEVEFKDKKQFQGVKRYLIEKEMSGKEILNLLDKIPKAFFALSFETGDTKLKIKPKAPKSGKPGSKGEAKPKADFCKIVTTNKKFAEEFIFEKPDFNDAEINHKFVIEKIEIPQELKDSKDFAKIREESFRVGKIIREAVINGEKIVEEKEFKA